MVRWGKASYLIVGGRLSGANSVSCAPAGTCAAGGDAAVTAVACPPAGRCVAGGYYLGNPGRYQAFVTYQESARRASEAGKRRAHSALFLAALPGDHLLVEAGRRG
jgi:hypothetical protein